ncbi:hypothetical protein V494_02555 [Pseudogymnoascus sp. VKM F-4513 (FW-928)]|nr:hypothetical protein V494_02555 [Pseudogymnoascus sp. VKM F-4513 (FW-928)]
MGGRAEGNRRGGVKILPSTRPPPQLRTANDYRGAMRIHALEIHINATKHWCRSAGGAAARETGEAHLFQRSIMFCTVGTNRLVTRNSDRAQPFYLSLRLAALSGGGGKDTRHISQAPSHHIAQHINYTSHTRSNSYSPIKKIAANLQPSNLSTVFFSYTPNLRTINSNSQDTQKSHHAPGHDGRGTSRRSGRRNRGNGRSGVRSATSTTTGTTSRAGATTSVATSWTSAATTVVRLHELKVGASDSRLVRGVNDDATVADEGSGALSEANVLVSDVAIVLAALKLQADLAGQITDLAAGEIAGVAGRVGGTVGVEVAASGGAVAGGVDGVDVDVEGWGGC